MAVPLADKYAAVAVVYYRYDHVAKDHVYNGDYCVHNGVALESLTQDNPAVVGHVAQWPKKHDRLTICDEKGAASADQAGQKGSLYHWAAVSVGHIDPTVRLWVWKEIHPYQAVMGHQPIAWMLDKPDDPHNGAFDRLEFPLDGTCILHYWHYVNPKPVSGEEDARTAKAPGKFVLRPGSERHEQVSIASWAYKS